MRGPIFKATFWDCSFGSRPGRSPRQALDRVSLALAQGPTWVVDADIRGCFDSIPHAPVLAAVARQVADGTLLDLLTAYLKAGLGTRPGLPGSPDRAVWPF